MSYQLTRAHLEKIPDELLREELAGLVKIGERVSATTTRILKTTFLKTETVIKGTITEATTLSDLYSQFESAAQQCGIKKVWIAGDIGSSHDSFYMKMVPGTSRLLRFRKCITHSKIIEACKEMGAYQEYQLHDAFARAITLIKSGEVDGLKGYGVTICLSDDRALKVWCRYSGTLGLDIYHVNAKNLYQPTFNDTIFDPGCGILVSDENLIK